MMERQAILGRRLGNEQAIRYWETGQNPYERSAPDIDTPGDSEVEQISVGVLLGQIEDIDRDISIVGSFSDHAEVLLGLRRGLGTFYTFLTGQRPPRRPYLDTDDDQPVPPSPVIDPPDSIDDPGKRSSEPGMGPTVGY